MKTTDTVDTNKTLVRRHYQEVLNQRNLAVIDEIYAPAIRALSVGMSESVTFDREQWKGFAQMHLSAFPDLEVSIEDQLAEGDKVVTRITGRGTHQGEFLGVAPTGKQVKMKAIHIHQIVEGEIAALWEEFDMFGLMQQLGALPM